MISLKLQKLKYRYIYIYIVAHSLNCFFNLCLGIWCGWNLGRRLLISSHYFKRFHRYNIRCKIKHINRTRESYNKACIDHCHSLLIHVQIYRNLTFPSLMKAILHYTGLEIATDTVANATNIFSLATKNSGLVAKVATRF